MILHDALLTGSCMGIARRILFLLLLNIQTKNNYCVCPLWELNLKCSPELNSCVAGWCLCTELYSCGSVNFFLYSFGVLLFDDCSLYH